MKLRFSPLAFSVLYCIAYVGAYVGGRPLFLYYPQSGHWIWGATPPAHEPGPAMVWYGLLATAALPAAVGAALLRDAWLAATLRNALWMWPYAAVAACLYMLRPFFL